AAGGRRAAARTGTRAGDHARAHARSAAAPAGAGPRRLDRARERRVRRRRAAPHPCLALDRAGRDLGHDQDQRAPPALDRGQRVRAAAAARVSARLPEAVRQVSLARSEPRGRQLHWPHAGELREKGLMDPVTTPERARRLARVLISDVAVYAGDQVRIGLEKDDLFDRLAPDIAAARTVYLHPDDPRVAAPPRPVHVPPGRE